MTAVTKQTLSTAVFILESSIQGNPREYPTKMGMICGFSVCFSPYKHKMTSRPLHREVLKVRFLYPFGSKITSSGFPQQRQPGQRSYRPPDLYVYLSTNQTHLAIIDNRINCPYLPINPNNHTNIAFQIIPVFETNTFAFLAVYCVFDMMGPSKFLENVCN